MWIQESNILYYFLESTFHEALIMHIYRLKGEGLATEAVHVMLLR